VHILGSGILEIATFSGYLLERYSKMQSLSGTLSSLCLSRGNCMPLHMCRWWEALKCSLFGLQRLATVRVS
jgi:hypothetical protein